MSLISRIPADKRQHLAAGTGLAAVLLVVVLLALYVAPWAGLAAGAVVLAIGVELYQRARNEGNANWPDAAASALPGLLLAGLAWWVGR